MNDLIAKPPRFIGVDVASAHLDIACHGERAVQRLDNNAAAIDRWLSSVPPGSVLAMESTGRYHELLAHKAYARGLCVYVLNPRDVHHYARSVGQRGKTDRLDALVIARYVAHEQAQLRPWQPLAPEVQRLQGLLRQRALLVRQQAALRQSLAPEADLHDLLQATLVPLKQAIAALEQRIAQATAALPQGRDALKRITAVPGLGPLSGAALLALFTRLAQAGADAVIAFTGLDPRPMDSGNKRGQRRLSKRGPAELRRLLFNAAMSAARTSTWRSVYERERSKGLPHTAAVVVLARKLVRVAFSLYKSGATFDSARQAAPATA